MSIFSVAHIAHFVRTCIATNPKKESDLNSQTWYGDGEYLAQDGEMVLSLPPRGDHAVEAVLELGSLGLHHVQPVQGVGQVLLDWGHRQCWPMST